MRQVTSTDSEVLSRAARYRQQFGNLQQMLTAAKHTPLNAAPADGDTVVIDSGKVHVEMSSTQDGTSILQNVKTLDNTTAATITSFENHGDKLQIVDTSVRRGAVPDAQSTFCIFLNESDPCTYVDEHEVEPPKPDLSRLLARRDALLETGINAPTVQLRSDSFKTGCMQKPGHYHYLPVEGSELHTALQEVGLQDLLLQIGGKQDNCSVTVHGMYEPKSGGWGNDYYYASAYPLTAAEAETVRPALQRVTMKILGTDDIQFATPPTRK